MDSLPDEFNAEQRGAARKLLYEYEDVFSKNEYDIERTPLVECHIDTGTNRPIRQGAVLQRLRRAKLKLKPSKYRLLQRKVEFLGHSISETGVEMQTSKIDAVVNWPRPRDTHQL